MVSSTSSVDPIVAVDSRSILYYGKYKYRARLQLNGLHRTHGSKTILAYLRSLEKYAANPWRPADIRKEIDAIDIDSIARYIEWRNTYAAPLDKSKKQALVRVESMTAAVFSNDLKLLQTLEAIAGADAVDYAAAVIDTPLGVKYFVKDPPYNYRIYLKSARVEEKFIADLSRFIDRYKDTATTIVPSGALSLWLGSSTRRWYLYCSNHYYIDYNDESTHTLLGIMFGDMIDRRFKLEKRP